MESLKILMSAYACEPNKGSEPGVGWRWALEMARLGHEVWTLTRENNRAGIEVGLVPLGAALASRLHFVYYDLPPRWRTWKRGGRGVQLYYVLWQWGAYRRARQLHRQQHFDAVHHITFGVTRQPSFMGRLGIPFVLGPLGGAERAPMVLRRHFPFGGFVRDIARDFANALAHLAPSVRRMLAQATVILVKTPESLAWLPSACRHKAHVMLEIGIDERLLVSATAPAAPDTAAENPAVAATAITLPDTGRPQGRDRPRELRLLYVGRFIYMKGMELGLCAVAALRARGVAVRLTMIGQGPQGERWRQLADALGIADRVTWIPWMKQDELLAAYASFDVFLFPSLHDSSGNVVLEAMAAGLPVVCLDLGGPARMVDAACGRVVEVDWLSEAQVAAGLANALHELAGDAALLANLKRGALTRAGQFGWRQVVGRVWGENGLAYRAVVDASPERLAYGHA